MCSNFYFYFFILKLYAKTFISNLSILKSFASTFFVPEIFLVEKFCTTTFLSKIYQSQNIYLQFFCFAFYFPYLVISYNQ